MAVFETKLEHKLVLWNAILFSIIKGFWFYYILELAHQVLDILSVCEMLISKSWYEKHFV
jgi:ABC-type iron transport system FetAB permease component